MSVTKTARIFDEQYIAIGEAMDMIIEGKCNRVDMDNGITVYKCGTVIRIDMKIKED